MTDFIVSACLYVAAFSVGYLYHETLHPTVIAEAETDFYLEIIPPGEINRSEAYYIY